MTSRLARLGWVVTMLGVAPTSAAAQAVVPPTQSRPVIVAPPAHPARPAPPVVVAPPGRPARPMHPPVMHPPVAPPPALQPPVLQPPMPPMQPGRPVIVAPVTPPAVRVPMPPPRPPREMRPPPVPGALWIDGYWDWTGNDYAWNPGRWTSPPEAGVTWVPPRWVVQAGAWVFRPGHWRRGWRHQPTVPTPTPIAVGAVVHGELQQGDLVLPDGALADDFVITLAPGQTVTFVVRARQPWAGHGAHLRLGLQLFFGGAPVTYAAPSDHEATTLSYTAGTYGSYVLRLASTAHPMAREGVYSLAVYPSNAAPAWPPY